MAFAHLAGKIKWLESQTSRSSRALLHVRAAQSFEANSSSTVPPALKSLVAMDLCYALLRNQFWLSAPIFCELLVEYLSDEYFLSRELAISLAEDLVSLAQSLTGDSDHRDISTWSVHHGLRDKEFLTYVFVSTATANSEEQLVLDLGLGTRLLRRIKGAAESAIQLSSQGSSGDSAEVDRPVLVFIPEIEALFAQIMADLSREVRSNPWAMEVHRLRFHLMQHISANNCGIESATIDAAFAAKLFSFLLTLGKARQLTEESIDKTLLDAALSADLAFVVDCSKRFGKPSRTVALTPTGEEITASAFAMELLPRALGSGSLDAELILTLPARYQLAVVKSMHSQSRHLLIDLIESYLQNCQIKMPSAHSPKNLSASALDSSLRYLMPQLTTSETQQLFVKLLSESLPTWIRTTTCTAMGQAGKTQYVRQLLRKVAESDTSANVREAARESLTHMESTV